MHEFQRRIIGPRLIAAAIAAFAVATITNADTASAQNIEWASDTNMVVVPDNGVRRDETGALIARAALDNTLDGIGAGITMPTTSNRAKIDAIEASVDQATQANGIVGLGGVNSHLFMWAAAKTLAASGNLDLTKPYELRIFGKIKQYRFTPSTDDPFQGNGVLQVVTGARYWPLDPNTGARDKQNKQVLRFRYRVRVRNNGFKVIERDDLDPNDPFPGSQIMFDDDMIEKLNERGYRYKLHAKGTTIRIQKVWVKENNGPWALIPKDETPGDPNDKYRSLYQQVDENCIDILFVDFPPTTKAGLGTTPAYCMGRCATPLIVNTGM